MWLHASNLLPLNSPSPLPYMCKETHAFKLLNPSTKQNSLPSWPCQSYLDLVSFTMALWVSSWPCQFHLVLVSLTLTIWVLPWLCQLHHGFVNLILALSVSPCPHQSYLDHVGLILGDFVSLHWLCKSHLDLVSLTLVLSVLPQPCQSHHCLVSLPSTMSVSNCFVAISLWPCQSHHLPFQTPLYLVSHQWTCFNLTVTLSVSSLPW